MGSLVEAPKRPKAENKPYGLVRPLDSILNTFKEHEAPIECKFLDRIFRGDLKEVITHREPWSYWTAELYGEGIKGQGGLGMLASDTLEVAAKLKIPMVFITPFYTRERSNRVENFEQNVSSKKVTPEERGFLDTGIDVYLSTCCDPKVKIDIYAKQKGSVTEITPTEENLGELYEGESNCDRRMYQNVVLGFGGYKALKVLGLKPSMNQQLNEAATVFSALARLDDQISKAKDLDKSSDKDSGDLLKQEEFNRILLEGRRKTIYTNHTVVPAAEAEFSLSQFEHFVVPNIESEELRSWLRKKIEGKGGCIKLSTLAIELSGKKNGVSLIHAREASKMYKDYDGREVKFEGVTNGISIDRWGAEDLIKLYREKGVLDEYDLPNIEKISQLNEVELRSIKNKRKEDLVSYLQLRKDQYGNPVRITEGAKIFNWRRRLADYKRPGMLFEKSEVLEQFLESQNVDLVMAGNVHPADGKMNKILKEILSKIDRSEILKRRVHFVQDYDEELGRKLSQGADVSVNTPNVRDADGNIKSTEACGTSWMKDVLNDTILISTDDGGVADLSVKAENEGRVDFSPPYLQIKGKTYPEEVRSLYSNLWKASEICDNEARTSWSEFAKKQLAAYLPTISGARMEEDYIKLGFPETTVFSSKTK